MVKKIISIILILSLSACILAQDQENYYDYQMGQSDGRMQGKSDASALWLLAGFGCGVFGFVAAAVSDGDSPGTYLMGKSMTYIQGYNQAYSKARKGKQMLYAGIGWALSIPVNYLLLSYVGY